MVALTYNLQRGMWAMIGTSIALGIWTSGLMWVSAKEEKKRLLMNEEMVDSKEAQAHPVHTFQSDKKV